MALRPGLALTVAEQSNGVGPCRVVRAPRRLDKGIETQCLRVTIATGPERSVKKRWHGACVNIPPLRFAVLMGNVDFSYYRCFAIKQGALIFMFAAILAACGADSPGSLITPPLRDPSCVGLYGAPNMNTGLSTEVCLARIEGDATWTPRVWETAAIAELRSWTLENPPTIPTEDPYQTTPDLRPQEDAVCAVMITDERRHRLETFESAIAAELAGGIVTHGHACGRCSSLDDLAAYAEKPDQTGPVRQCTMENLGGTVEELDACIQSTVGFTPPCARTWAYHAMNATRECQSICLAHMASPYNEQDGSLNPCLQCDEEWVPLFTAVAGRTRRSSGVAAAICRPCDTVWRVDHWYE